MLPESTVDRLRQALRETSPEGERYELREPVGQGGMGTVYRAFDRTLEREVAIKVLRPGVGDPGTAARLEREARILARLEHPGIVPVHDAGTLPDGRIYYVMKLVRGERMERVAQAVPTSELLRLFLRICETVGFAHAQGIVHRDLKPSNVMVGSFGEVLVLDWGIARVTRDPEADGRAGPTPEARAEAPRRDADSPHTAPGTVLGTPGFMAPEQAQGWHHLVDARTDVYALGAILRALVQPEPAAGRAPRALVSIWSRAMAAEPDQRYESAAALAADVARYLDGEPVQAHRESAVERAGRFFRKYQTAIVLVLTYLLIRFLFLAARGL
ncbi:MAG TPA: serine/threonine-protein kinase [Gemmatimonadales bacterium]|nr:serine/threonine-protein kinase [Gemmatimonadales bacterium]